MRKTCNGNKYFSIQSSFSNRIQKLFFAKPILLPGDRADMAKMLARLTILLIGADACTSHIINSVWGKNDDARLALGTMW